MTVICLTFWQNCRNVVSLEDKYLDCSPFGEELLFLSVPKMGDGIVVNVAAGIVICFLYGILQVSIGSYSTFSAVNSGIERNI